MTEMVFPRSRMMRRLPLAVRGPFLPVHSDSESLLWARHHWESACDEKSPRRTIRHSGWQTSHPGDHTVRQRLHLIFKNNGLPIGGTLFDRAYAYIRENY